MTVFPDGKVYIAFDDGPYVASPTFTDVTSYVRSFSTHRGRSSDFDQFDTGVAQITFDNRVRTFDPFYSTSVTRTNLVPNPSFEIDVSGWIVASVSLARITTDSLFGSASMQITSLSASDTTARTAYDPNTTAAAGETFTASAYVKNTAGNNREHRVYLRFFNSGGGTISSSFGSATVNVGSAWTRVSVTATAPANTASVDVAIYTQATNPSLTNVTLCDGVLLEKSGSLGTYFDGGLDPYAYGTATQIGWTGTAGNSTSTRTAPASRINLVTNPSFETNLTGWDITGTVNRVTTQFYVGTASAEMVYSGAGTVLISNTTRITVAAGLSYAYSFYCKQSVDTGNVVSNILWFNSAGVQILDDVHQSNNPNTTWQRFSQIRTAPNGATSMVLRIYQTAGEGGGAVATNNYIDGIVIEQAAAVADYFDGSTYSTGTLGIGQSSWTGTANGSTSQLLQFPRDSQLTPRRQVKITGVANSVEYDVFRGFIAGWPVTWSEYGKDSTVTVQCFDALGLMVNEQVPTDWPDYYTRAQSPTAYFKGSDSQGTAVIRDQIVGSTKTMVNTDPATNPNFFETPALTPNSPSNSVFCASYVANNLTNAVTPNPILAGAYPIFSLSAWLKGTGPTNLGYNEIRVGNRGGYAYVYYSTNSIRFTFSREGIVGTPNQIVDAPYVPNLGQPFHLFIIVDDTPNATVYINGQLATTTSTASGSGSGGVWPMQVQAKFVNFQELAVWERINFTAADVAAIYGAGAGRFTETTSARMTRILDTTSWPAALESFPASPAGTVAEIGSGTGVIQELQLVADSEGGELYATKAGVLTMTARRDVFNATRSKNVQATISDSGTGIRYGSEIEIAYDADNLKNDVTVNYSGDGEVVQTNTVTIAAYGAAATVVETQLDSPTSANDLATLELGVEGVLVPQLSTIDVSANTAAADWQSIFGLELLDRVNFKRTPTVGGQFSRDALINSIDHQVEPGLWRTQLTLSMRYTSPLTCDDPVLGKVDFNYCG